MLGMIIMVGIICVLCLVGFIAGIVHNDSDVIVPCFCGFIALGLLLWWGIYTHNFNVNKTVVYQKPTIKIIEKKFDYVTYVFDSNTLKTYTAMKWNNTNNIYWKVSFYKSKTNRSIVYKEIQ